MSGPSLSIGDVVASLQPDFPDVSISKLRFLEAEGLVTPTRTGAGYRTFSTRDVERLRYILTAQRDRFWPLKVIRESLDALDRGLTPVDEAGDALPKVPAAEADPHLPTASDLARRGNLRLTAAELRQASGLDGPTFDALVGFGLLRADQGGHFGDPALAVARAAGALSAYGIEPRHLRSFRTAADREIGLVQQVVTPLRGRPATGTDTGGPSGAAENSAPQALAQVLAQCLALHAALVRAGLHER